MTNNDAAPYSSPQLSVSLIPSLLGLLSPHQPLRHPNSSSFESPSLPRMSSPSLLASRARTEYATLHSRLQAARHALSSSTTPDPKWAHRMARRYATQARHTVRSRFAVHQELIDGVSPFEGSDASSTTSGASCGMGDDRSLESPIAGHFDSKSEFCFCPGCEGRGRFRSELVESMHWMDAQLGVLVQLESMMRKMAQG